MRQIVGLLTAAALISLTACSRTAVPVNPHGPSTVSESKAAVADPYSTAVQVPGDLSATVKMLDLKDKDVTAFSFADADHGWLSQGNLILATTDGGKTWDPQFDAGELILHLDFISSTEGWAATKAGLLHTVDGGKTWIRNQGDASLRSDFVDIHRGWAFGKGGLIATTDGGKTWLPTSTDCTEETRAFSFVSAHVGYALCTGQGSAGMQAKGLKRTRDGGRSWETVGDLGKGGYGASLFFLDENQGWYGLSRGTLFQTKDGGITWTVVPGFVPEEHFISQIQFLTPEQGFVVARYGGHATLLGTKDGSKSFQPVYPDISPVPMQMLDAKNWVAAGTELDHGAILRTANGGKTWRQVGSIPGVRITTLSFVDLENAFASVEEQQGDHIARKLMRTIDGGASWTLVRETPTDLKEIFMYLSFISQQTGFAGSGWGHLSMTEDGGKTWKQMDATDSAGQNFDFVSPKRGWKTRDFELQATEDGGRTWAPVGLRTRVVSFDLLPDGTAWVVGGELGPGGHKSQVFMTRDWGRTWTRVNLSGLAVGLVRFADPEHGILQSGDSLFMTEDGGHTWTQFR